MIRILETSRELNKKEKYLMTKSPAIESLSKTEDNISIPVDAWLIFSDSKDTGEEVEILSILSGAHVYSCQSETFKRSFADIVEVMEGEQFSIQKISGETKAGRPYINCILDIDSI